MKINSKTLLKELAAITQQNLETALAFVSLTDEHLNVKPAPQAWSILECLEHLNLYAAFYLPEIEKSLAKERQPQTIFKSGFMGNYLVSMVKPKADGKKMTTFAAMNPAGKQLSREVLSQFVQDQRKLLEYLAAAESTNLNSGGIPVTFTKLVKLRLGDTLRFMVYHNQRHVLQAQRNVQQLKHVAQIRP